MEDWMVAVSGLIIFAIWVVVLYNRFKPKK